MYLETWQNTISHCSALQHEPTPPLIVPQILTARVYRIAVETPLQDAPMLSKQLGNTVLLKREDMQVRCYAAGFS